ncbi:unnamed protein product, partial [marine sediment metagenome]
KKDESKTGKQTEKKETATKDFDIWFPKIEFIDTIHEERIKIPVLSAGKEARIFQFLARLLEKLPSKQIKAQIQNEEAEAFSAADLLDMLPKLLKEAPKEAFSIASEILTSKERPIDEKWVQDNLNFDKILQLTIPFVVGEAKLFEKVSGLFEKMPLLANF